MQGQSATAVVQMLLLCPGASSCALILLTEEGGRSRATLSGSSEICAGSWLVTGYVCPLVGKKRQQRVWLLTGTCP